MKGTPFIKNNIKILQLMIDAYNGNYDADFEDCILPQLQWLDKMICNNIPDKVKEDYNDWDIFNNYSIYYYNDMMRKITISGMMPEYLKKNENAKALLLAGMASERMRSLLHVRQNKEKYARTERWNIDYYTDVFDWMNTLPVESVIKYQRILQSGGRDAFEKFFASKCYKNNDYLNEIIGTKYMRLEQFDKATKYLSKVSQNYMKTLNIYVYFKDNPFQVPYRYLRFNGPYPDYKLDFATRMMDLQGIMKAARNRELKAEATYQYALGLMRAAYDSECWALVHYEKNCYHKIYDWDKSMEKHYREGMNEVMRSSSNDELKAGCLIAEMWLSGDDRFEFKYVNNDWKEVPNPNSVFIKNFNLLKTNYIKTDIVRQVNSECDNFFFYHK
jgi:hypothetical protein